MPEILQLPWFWRCCGPRSPSCAVRALRTGYTTETLIITALLVAAAVVAGGIIVALIMRKANELSGA